MPAFCIPPLRDFLLNLALTDLFAARWTERIHDEWIENLLAKQPRLAREKLERTRALMNEAIPDSVVTHYEALIEGLELPDPNDRHVLAAAIKTGAQIIVTFNLKDFPAAQLEPYGIEAVHPDTFVEYQMTLREGAVATAAKAQRVNLRKPSVSAQQLLGTLAARVWSSLQNGWPSSRSSSERHPVLSAGSPIDTLCP